MSGDKAAEFLNDLVSKIRVEELAPVKGKHLPSVRLEFIKEHALSYLKQLYSSSIKNSGYPDTSLNNIQYFEKEKN